MNDFISELEQQLEGQNRAFSLVVHALTAAGHDLIAFDPQAREELDDICAMRPQPTVPVRGSVRA